MRVEPAPSPLVVSAPDPRLSAFVVGYWFVRDMAGAHAGTAVRTSPHPGAVLTVNLGRPNAMVDGPVVPRTSLLGLQTVARGWRSWSETYFVMAMLTVEGLARLFPFVGSSATDRLLDLGALIGDRAASALASDVDAVWAPERIRPSLDRWLLARLDGTPPPAEYARFAASLRTLRETGNVTESAEEVGTSRRHLNRWFRTHAGLAPKQLLDLERFQASLRAVQTRRGDPLEGFSDQPHQIRSWRRRIGVSPGMYARQERSVMAGLSRERSAAPGPSFYL